MMVDFASLILSVDSTIDNGVIKVFQDEDGVKFQVNGSKVNPDFNIDGNFLSTEGSGDEQFVSLDLIASDTDEQSLLVFQFLRITSFTVPEP